MNMEHNDLEFTSKMANKSSDINNNLTDLSPEIQDALQSAYFEFVVQGISLTSVSIMGLMANSVCLLVMSRPALKKGQCSSVNALLSSMAAVDIIVLICSLLMCGLPSLTSHLLYSRPDDNDYTVWVLDLILQVHFHTLPYVYPIGLAAQTASVYLTVVVTIERYIVVCRPLHAKAICTLGKTRKTIVFVCLFALLYNGSRFFEYKNETRIVENMNSNTSENGLVAHISNNSSIYENMTADDMTNDVMRKTNVDTIDFSHHFDFENETSDIVSKAGGGEPMYITSETMVIIATPLRTNDVYITVYINWLYLIVMYIIPFGILVILNYRIAQRIRIARANRLRMSSTAFLSADRRSSKSERKHKFSQSFVSIQNSRSCLLSDVEQKARHEEMENLNHSDKSNIANGSPTGSIFGNNHLNTNEPLTEGNHNDGDLPCKRKRSKDLINLREEQLEREQQSLAIMQMVVVLIFVLCNCLAMVSNILEAFKVEAVPLTQVSNLLVTINSSINLFVYCVFGKRFRLELKQLLSICLPACGKCPKVMVRLPNSIPCNEPTVCYTANNVTICIHTVSDGRNIATDV